MKDSQKIEIHSIKDDQLIDVLKKYNLYDKIINNEVICSFCAEPLSFDAINYIYINNNKLNLICNKNECIENLNNKNYD